MIYDIAKRMIDDINLSSKERIEAEKLLILLFKINPPLPKKSKYRKRI